MAARIGDACDGAVNGKTIAVLGVTFKPNTDDMRAAPRLDIVPALIGAGAKVRAYDPEGMRQATPLLPGAARCKNAYEAMAGADAVSILTEGHALRGHASRRHEPNGRALWR